MPYISILSQFDNLTKSIVVLRTPFFLKNFPNYLD